MIDTAARAKLGHREQIDKLVDEAVARIVGVNPATAPKLDEIKHDLSFALLKAADEEDREIVQAVLELESGNRLVRATQWLVVATCLLVLATAALVVVDMFSH